MAENQANGEKKERAAITRPFTVHDSLPQGKRKASELEEALETVKQAPPGKWVCIGVYKSSPAATGAANILKSRHGRRVDVEGFAFATRKTDEESSGLFASYDPRKVVAGAKEAHVEDMKKRDAAAAKRKIEREKGKTKVAA